jgi:hypothetical protein
MKKKPLINQVVSETASRMVESVKAIKDINKTGRIK